MEKNYTVRVRKVLSNELLHRKQMVIEVIHPGLANVSKVDLKEKVAKHFKARPEQVVVYGLRTAFGGSRTSGFAMLYSSKDHLTKIEPKYRQRRAGLLPPRVKPPRKQRKELHNKKKKFRGVAKNKVTLTKKK
jgi:small subunit ribosomal protein S24e